MAQVDWSDYVEVESLDVLAKLAALNAKRADISKKWNELWTKHKLDAIITPTTRTTAVEHDAFAPPPYTVFVNLLDVSS
jgi:hypothetical protein